MKKAYINDERVQVGDVVCLRVSKQERSHTNPTGVIGIVSKVDVQTKGVQVVTVHGAIANKGNKRAATVAPESYIVRSPDVVIPNTLTEIKEGYLGWYICTSHISHCCSSSSQRNQITGIWCNDVWLQERTLVHERLQV